MQSASRTTGYRTDVPVSNKFDYSLLCQEREQTHAKEVPPPGQRGYPDVYVDSGDYTVTIDPMKNTQWIRDDSHAHRSAATQHRGALKDHASVMHAVKIVDVHPAPDETFVPTFDMLDRSKKLSQRCVSTSTHGFPMRRGNPHSRNPGQLPHISQRIWKNQLPNKPDFLVERDQWISSTHADRNRAFDCGGGGWTCR